MHILDKEDEEDGDDEDDGTTRRRGRTASRLTHDASEDVVRLVDLHVEAHGRVDEGVGGAGFATCLHECFGWLRSPRDVVRGDARGRGRSEWETERGTKRSNMRDCSPPRTGSEGGLVGEAWFPKRRDCVPPVRGRRESIRRLPREEDGNARSVR